MQDVKLIKLINFNKSRNVFCSIVGEKAQSMIPEHNNLLHTVFITELLQGVDDALKE